MAKGSSSNKTPSGRKITLAQIVFIIISLLVLFSMILSAVAKY